ncbi:hypothetical protein PJI17_25735 [Mycobacterium kansasii]
MAATRGSEADVMQPSPGAAARRAAVALAPRCGLLVKYRVSGLG